MAVYDSPQQSQRPNLDRDYTPALNLSTGQASGLGAYENDLPSIYIDDPYATWCLITAVMLLYVTSGHIVFSVLSRSH
jgi:hypothetical protein